MPRATSNAKDMSAHRDGSMARRVVTVSLPRLIMALRFFFRQSVLGTTCLNAVLCVSQQSRRGERPSKKTNQAHTHSR